MKIIVLYHANCTDGAGAMWSAWKHFGNNAEYIGVGKQSKNQKKIIQKCIDADEVFMCDMMMNLSKIREFLKAGTKVNVLDHHISNIEILTPLTPEFNRDYPGLFNDFCDLSRSGAGLTWDHFHGGSRPVIIDYIEDFDLWHWALPDGDSIHTYLSQFTWNKNDEIIEKFNEWENLSPGHFAARGAPLVEFKSQLIKRNLSQVGRALVLGQYNVPILNTHHFISETGHIMAVDEPFAILWSLTKNGLIRMSFRSNEGNEDVMKIAQKIGKDGGGHARAAGSSFENFDELTKQIKIL